MRTSRLSASLTATVCFFAGSVAFAYEPATHDQIASQAVEYSVLAADRGPNHQPVVSRCALLDLGLELPSNSKLQAFPNDVVADTEVEVQPRVATVVELIRDGARFEDHADRAANHFYDPTNGQPLSSWYIPTDMLEIIGTDYTSPDWALEDKGQISGQDFSYADARQYMYDALTNPDGNARNQDWGKLFQTLGQVMHHLQDMAQPQHVRDDPHLDKYAVQIKGVQLNPLYNPSLYEQYSASPDVTLPLTASYPALNFNVFATPREFWQNGGMGIAEFTNSNFFSDATNVDPASGQHAKNYSSPALLGTVYYDDIQTLCANAKPACPNPNLVGVMEFMGSEVTDQYDPGASDLNSYATTFSIFSSDLKRANGQSLYTLNRFNFDAQLSYLIPRAVAYSAGLINYFFRGQMKISLPDEGVYAIIDDQDPAIQSNPLGAGFPKVKLKIQNVTSDGVDSNGQSIIEPMQSGGTATLVAVAKFHRNDCYQANLSGEYGSPGINWHTCRDPNESIVVSAPVAVPDGINTAPQEVTFDFSQNPIPVSATDLYLQVVYQGPLGGEQGAVVVTTQDISEPTYYYSYSTPDQVTYCYSYPDLTPGCGESWQTWCASGFPSQPVSVCDQAMGVTAKLQFTPTSQAVAGYDPNSSPASWAPMPEPAFSPVAVMPAPIGTMPRVAVLLDASPGNELPTVEEQVDSAHGIAQYRWNYQPAFADTEQLDPSTGVMTISEQYGQARGVYVYSADVGPLSAGDASPFPLLTIGPSQLNF